MDIRYLGLVDYQTAWDLQKKLIEQRANDEIGDTLLLLEHPHTFTFGRSGKREHLLVDGETLTAQQIALYNVDRGGDITYHGPGQLVGYPILKLKDYPLSYRGYLRLLEEIIIETLEVCGQRAYREAGYTGVWVPAKGAIRSAKLAAIGVKVNVKRITSHGFAINLNTDLSYFGMIIPCGIQQCQTTSLGTELGQPIDVEAFSHTLAHIFTETFTQLQSNVVLTKRFTDF